MNRVDLRDARQQGRESAADERAGLDLGLADQAVVGSGDPRVAEIDLGPTGRGLPRLDGSGRRLGQGDSGFVFLTRDRGLRHQRREACHVLLRARQLGFRVGELGAGLGQRLLEGARVERVEQLTPADAGPLLEMNLLDESLDAGPDLGLGVAARLANRLDVDGDVAVQHRRHLHRGRRRCGGRLGLAGHSHAEQGCRRQGTPARCRRRVPPAPDHDRPPAASRAPLRSCRPMAGSAGFGQHATPIGQSRARETSSSAPMRCRCWARPRMAVMNSAPDWGEIWIRRTGSP